MSELVVPTEYSRAGNTSHTGELHAIQDNEQFSYGTAGFRFPAEKLPFIVFRCAYVASLRARQLNSAIGMMITASHNPPSDNGVKLVDPGGDMLNKQWEKYSGEIVNATDSELPAAVRAMERQITVSKTEKSRVVCGMDTRASGPYLMAAAKAGAALFNVEFVDIGVVTTPMLHYAVKAYNEPEFAEPTHKGYYTSIAGAFNKLHEITVEPDESRYQHEIVLDCANGVGAPRFRNLLELIPEKFLRVNFFNETGELNHECGADFVKIAQKLPANFKSLNSLEKCASFDGDADRLMYFRPKVAGKEEAELFDGDKIAVLIATYICEHVKAYHQTKPRERLHLGIVQTAYANGSSTRYIREVLGLEPIIVPTGVKHLHEAATEYDIGIYFEANGHGTVTFSEIFDRIIRRDTTGNISLRRLALFSRVINETVGDAIADLLAVEIVLRHYGWSMDDWAEKLYKDMPNGQIKVPVEDRSIFKTTKDEQRLVKPLGIQKKIDEEVAKYKDSRAFIRPSGTENIVRVYAEADTIENTLQLGKSLEQLVLNLRDDYSEKLI